MANLINADTSNGLQFTSDTSGEIKLQSAGTDTVTVDSSGNVGIGTSSPSTTLDVETTIRSKANAATNDATVGKVSFYNTNASASANPERAYIEAGRQNSAWGAYLKFATSDATSASSEKMRIDSSGNCFWNGTSIIENTKYNFYFTSATNGIGSKTDTTSTSYHVRWHNPNGVVGGVYTNGSNTTYTTSSDYRLKENIVPMTKALDKVMQLNPVTYTWKVDGTEGQGFIAHELQAIVPDCVGGEKDAIDEEGNPVYQGIDTSFLVATLTKAIQEQQEQIKALETRIQALENA